MFSGKGKAMKTREVQIRSALENLHMPENLAIGLQVAKQHEKCRNIGCDFDYFGFAFGQSPFQVLPSLRKALEVHAGSGGYVSAAGIEELREEVAGFYRRQFGLDVRADRVVVGPGTKTLIYMMMQILEGDVIIPSPAWIGYAPQASLQNKSWHVLNLRRENGYRLDAGELEDFLGTLPGCQHLLIMNNPNNPTGNVYTREELEAVAEVCRRTHTLVLSDEIYALTAYDREAFVSMGTVYPEGTIVSGGLSKDRSAGGYRLGVCILPTEGTSELSDAFEKLAATLYTSVTTPVQLAAVLAYQDHAENDLYFDTTRAIHRIMGTTLSRMCNDIEGLSATTPQGGFYFFLDFQELGQSLAQHDVRTSNALGAALLDHPYHIATVTGDAVMLPPKTFGARIAFVDYDGEAAYRRYLDSPPRSDEEQLQFVRDAAPRMIQGVDALRTFVEKCR